MASQVQQPPSGMAKASEPNRNKKYDPKKPHITEEPITKTNWYKHVNWLNVTLIVGLPIYGLIAAYWTPLQLKTAIWAVAYYFMTGLGITAGKLMLMPMTLRPIANTFLLLQATTDCGHTHHTQQQPH
jgi:stearoyl-CoA desaturase (delta-9 desaturase)